MVIYGNLFKIRGMGLLGVVICLAHRISEEFKSLMLHRVVISKYLFYLQVIPTPICGEQKGDERFRYLNRIWHHLLIGQETRLSRGQLGFEPRWCHHYKKSIHWFLLKDLSWLNFNQQKLSGKSVRYQIDDVGIHYRFLHRKSAVHMGGQNSIRILEKISAIKIRLRAVQDRKNIVSGFTSLYGALVQWLVRWLVTPEARVRFPYVPPICSVSSKVRTGDLW